MKGAHEIIEGPSWTTLVAGVPIITTNIHSALLETSLHTNSYIHESDMYVYIYIYIYKTRQAASTFHPTPNKPRNKRHPKPQLDTNNRGASAANAGADAEVPSKDRTLLLTTVCFTCGDSDFPETYR